MEARSQDWMVMLWLQSQVGPAAERMLFDSDVARAFGWTGQQADAVLARLEGSGLLDTRVFIQPGGGRSLGDLRLTRAGLDALRSQPAAKAKPGRFRRTFAA